MGHIVRDIASINQSLHSSLLTHSTITKPTIICGNNKRPPRLNPILDTKVIQWNILKSTYWSFLKALSLGYLKFYVEKD
jgi:hypothetical protein